MRSFLPTDDATDQIASNSRDTFVEYFMIARIAREGFDLLCTGQWLPVKKVVRNNDNCRFRHCQFDHHDADVVVSNRHANLSGCRLPRRQRMTTEC